MGFLRSLRVLATSLLILGGIVFPAVSSESNPGEDLGVRVPDGFRVSWYADDALAHDIYAMTIDARGRVVVSGRNYIKVLHDDDDDGRADRATLFSSLPKSGAQGLCFVGADLLCSGDNALLRLSDTNGDGVADGEPEVWAKLASAEHGTHGIVQGPDGAIYVVVGNEAGLSADQITSPRSPVTQPQCGAILRFTADGKEMEVVAHGFRNSYDLGFDAYGRLWTVDSDGERDQYLPWYSATRLFEVGLGLHHGWVQRGWQHSWNRPAYFFDAAPRVAEFGRGSPTGLVVYRHRQFPANYRGLFSCCWTLGRIYHVALPPLQPTDPPASVEPSLFLETNGKVGFAPVDLAIGRRGEMYVAIGGRQTRGGVLKIEYQAGSASASAAEKAEALLTLSSPDRSTSPGSPDALTRAIDAVQPLDSWSRAAVGRLLQGVSRPDLVTAAADRRRSLGQRLRCIELITEQFGGLDQNEFRQLAEASDLAEESAIRARLNWSLSRNASRCSEPATMLLSRSGDRIVERSAWQARLTLGIAAGTNLVDAIKADDRIQRESAIAAMARHGSEIPIEVTGPESDLTRYRMRLLQGKLAPDDAVRIVEALEAVRGKVWQLEALRLVQHCLGDIRSEPTEPAYHAGYVARDLNAVESLRDKLGPKLAYLFPQGDADVDREIIRCCGMLGVTDADLVSRAIRRLPGDAPLEEQIHYLMAISLMGGPRDATTTASTAKRLVGLHRIMRERGMMPSRNWPMRIGEMFSGLQQRDAKLALAVVRDGDFGMAEHSLFVAGMKGEVQREGARNLLKANRAAAAEETWTVELVRMVGMLTPGEGLPELRQQWTHAAVRDAVAIELARQSQVEDRGRLLESLESIQPEVVVMAAKALQSQSSPTHPEDYLAVLAALRQASTAKELTRSRQQLIGLLEKWSGEKRPTGEPDPNGAKAYVPWFAWFRQVYPRLAKQLDSISGEGIDWQARLAQIDWARGNAAMGKQIFEKRQCARCHQAADRLGPDLTNVAARFSREDLFAAVVDPGRDVAPLYQTTQIATRSGKVYQGMVVYESPEGTLVQVSPDTTERIAGDEIVLMKKTRHSLMPTGLLNGLVDRDLADLYAYIQTLTADASRK